jgi:hypothetical protein
MRARQRIIEIAVFECPRQAHRCADGIKTNGADGHAPEKFRFSHALFEFEKQVSEADSCQSKGGPGKEAEIPGMLITVHVGKKNCGQSLYPINPRCRENECNRRGRHRHDVGSPRAESNGEQSDHQRTGGNAIEGIDLPQIGPSRSRVPYQELFEPERIGQQQNPRAPAENLRRQLTRSCFLRPHAIENESERNADEKEKYGRRKAAEKLAEPKPFAGAVLRSNPGI